MNNENITEIYFKYMFMKKIYLTFARKLLYVAI